MTAPVLTVPPGCCCNGRSEIIPGRAVLHFTDNVTGSDFVVPEQMATEAMILKAMRDCRARFMTAGAAFGPVV